MKYIRNILIWKLTLIARLILWRHAPKIIAVTGSVGKTTTKDAIYAALSPHIHIRKNAKTFNTEIGVPLTILGCENPWWNPFAWMRVYLRGIAVLCASHYPAWLVLEVGTDKPGDIASIAKWLRPHIVVFTGVPEIPTHVEYFDSPEAVFEEKMDLPKYMRARGTLIASGDDARIDIIRSRFRSRLITYGVSETCDYVASRSKIQYENGMPTGMYFRLDHAGSSLPAFVPGALGTPRTLAALAACAVGRTLKIDLVSIVSALEAWEPAPGRMRILEGKHGSVLIDDSYNASPSAVNAALESVRDIECAGRKIVMLGDMLELGRYSVEAHRALGERVAAIADMLITVGLRSKGIAEAARDNGLSDAQVRVYESDESLRAGHELEDEIKKGDVILIKGSQGMRMERAVRLLLKDQSRAKELLVRQEDEWLEKA